MRSVHDYAPCSEARRWLEGKTEEEAWNAVVDTDWIVWVLCHLYPDDVIRERLSKYPEINDIQSGYRCLASCIYCRVDKIGHEAVKQEFPYKELAGCSET